VRWGDWFLVVCAVMLLAVILHAAISVRGRAA
jgi:hypothetical protein